MSKKVNPFREGSQYHGVFAKFMMSGTSYTKPELVAAFKKDGAKGDGDEAGAGVLLSTRDGVYGNWSGWGWLGFNEEVKTAKGQEQKFRAVFYEKPLKKQVFIRKVGTEGKPGYVAGHVIYIDMVAKAAKKADTAATAKAKPAKVKATKTVKTAKVKTPAVKVEAVKVAPVLPKTAPEVTAEAKALAAKIRANAATKTAKPAAPAETVTAPAPAAAPEAVAVAVPVETVAAPAAAVETPVMPEAAPETVTPVAVTPEATA